MKISITIILKLVTKMDIIILIIPSGLFMNAIATVVVDGCIIFLVLHGVGGE